MLSYAQENRRLFARAREGDDAAAGLIAELNMKLVHALAGRLCAATGAEYDELVGAGLLGLTKAIKSYDERRGTAFSTYAVPVIAGEMKRLLRDGGPVKVSRDIRERAVKIARISRIIEAEQGRSPTPAELAERLGCPLEDVLLSLDAARAPLSLEQERGEGGSLAESAAAAENDRGLDAETMSLRAAVEKLPRADAAIITLRYFGGLTQAQTAQRLSLTQVQVSRREKKILAALREQLSD